MKSPKTGLPAKKGGDEDLMALEARHCSWGDTVHYAKELTMFTRAEGIYLYDEKETPYLDLQMWYSAVELRLWQSAA